MANFLQDLEAGFSSLAEHLRPNSGAFVEEIVLDVKNVLGTVLGDIKADLAYLHSRLDQWEAPTAAPVVPALDPTVETPAVATETNDG